MSDYINFLNYSFEDFLLLVRHRFIWNASLTPLYLLILPIPRPKLRVSFQEWRITRMERRHSKFWRTVCAGSRILCNRRHHRIIMHLFIMNLRENSYMRWQVSRRYRKFPTLDTSVVEVGQELITASTIFCHLQKTNML